MMLKENRDIRPVLLKLGVVLALSCAGFLYSRFKNRTTKSSKPPLSPDHVGGVYEEGERAGTKNTFNPRAILSLASGKHEDSSKLKVASDNPAGVLSPSRASNGEKDGNLSPEFNDYVKEFDLAATRAGIFSDEETTQAAGPVEKDDPEKEIRHLKATVSMLREKEKNLESQLLEFYGLKEQEKALSEMLKRLHISDAETKLLASKVDALQADNQRLQALLDDHGNLVAELDKARTEIKFLRKRVKFEAEHNREQILALQKRVHKLQEEELKAAAVDSDIQLKLKRLRDLEVEAENLRKSNLRLTLENSELARQVQSTQIPANSEAKDPQAETLRELQNKVKQEKEHLAKEVERLQADRFQDSEELVYLRWINACLRYELRNCQPGNSKTVARDLSKSLSPKSEERAKQLILEYANSEELWETGVEIVDFESDHLSASHTSYDVDSGDLDDSVNSPKSRNSRKLKFFNKLRRLIRGKDTYVSSMDQIAKAEDSESSCGSSSISTAADGENDAQVTRTQSLCLDLSRRFSRHSVDIKGVKNMEIGRSNSDLGFCYRHRRVSSGMVNGSHLSQENQLERSSLFAEKSELLKFAEVLKYPGNATRTCHRRAASLSSYGAFRPITS